MAEQHKHLKHTKVKFSIFEGLSQTVHKHLKKILSYKVSSLTRGSSRPLLMVVSLFWLKSRYSNVPWFRKEAKDSVDSSLFDRSLSSINNINIIYNLCNIQQE